MAKVGERRSAPAGAEGRGPDEIVGSLWRDPRGPILIALMISMSLAALDSTVVTTAVPSIVRDLGGFSLFPWLFSIYLLTQAVTVPIYGRLADLFGRRPVLYLGIALFLLGSVLCGLAWNMTALIAFRGLQGLGAGSILPTVQTVIGDQYSVRERARVQGYTASVWGVASVVGPLLGGALSQLGAWRWIFYLNLPIGGLAIVLLARHLHESVVRRPHYIDYPGAIALSGGLTAVIFGLLQGGVAWPWSSATELAVLITGGGLLAAFVVIEHHVPEPMVPPWVMSRRPLAAGNISSLALGAVLLGITSYVPAFVQGVHGLGPLVSGLVVGAVTIGWPVSAAFAGRIYLRIGFRSTAIIGGVGILVGSLLYATLQPDDSIVVISVYGVVTGLGMGLVATPVLVALQSLVGWERRGVVTASNMFSRTVGSAVGIAVLGSIANSSLASSLAGAPAHVAKVIPQGVDAASRILGGGHASLPPAAAEYLRGGLFDAIHAVFVGLAVISAVGLIALIAIPRRLEPMQFEEPVAGVGAEEAAAVGS